jgi:HlyD family secretion protein
MTLKARTLNTHQTTLHPPRPERRELGLSASVAARRSCSCGGSHYVWLWLSCLICCCAVGCNLNPGVSPAATQAPPQPDAPKGVTGIHPLRKDLRYRIEQPGFNIEAFQTTSLFARISGYLKSWKVDIGDAVQKDQLLAELSVPEMQADLEQKEAAIRQAAAQVDQSKATVASVNAQLERFKSQYERLKRAGDKGLLDRDNVDETRLNYEAGKAAVQRAEADIAVAEAQLEVARANRDYSQAMLQYAHIVAPYDGIITARNVNNGDFVQPAGTGEKHEPLFIISQVDPVRIFVNIPGPDAVRIVDGGAVTLRLQGAGGQVFSSKITRNARSLSPQSRTLRAEIDLPNPDGKLLPGMYVQATIAIDRPQAWTLPASAVATEGDDTFCYVLHDGKAQRRALQVGLRIEGQVEILKIAGAAASDPWQAPTGEEMVADSATGLSEGQAVKVSKPK